MILLKTELLSAIEKKEIIVDPFDVKNVGPNSIDVTLMKTLKTYQPGFVKKINNEFYFEHTKDKIKLDSAKQNKVYKFEIPEEGVYLQPGILYLGSTNEVAGSQKYLPMYEGRSSMARLGLKSHLSAGFGDIGFSSNWTLEIEVAHMLKIYPDMRIGQVFFQQVNEEALKEMKENNFLYLGKYNSQKEPQESKSFLDFNKEDSF